MDRPDSFERRSSLTRKVVVRRRPRMVNASLFFTFGLTTYCPLTAKGFRRRFGETLFPPPPPPLLASIPSGQKAIGEKRSFPLNGIGARSRPHLQVSQQHCE